MSTRNMLDYRYYRRYNHQVREPGPFEHADFVVANVHKRSTEMTSIYPKFRLTLQRLKKYHEYQFRVAKELTANGYFASSNDGYI